MPTVQIATFLASDEFVANPEIFRAPVDVIKTTDGHIGSYYGFQVEESKTGYFVTVWESYEHHQRLIADPSYGTLLQALKPASAGQFIKNHIEAKVDPTAALSSPAVEFVTFTLKDPGSAEKLVSLLEDLAKGLDIAVGEHPPCFWGQSKEDHQKYLLVVGWDTVAAHWEAVKEGSALRPIVVAISEIANLEIGHSLLKNDTD
ncbi:hypothetical protein C8J57DRAFT_1279563 [Mycena rebaudengoi]|nr:hypothetical protein C8J57DRAFT_1279563 [Mycena rebaudengoi]